MSYGTNPSSYYQDKIKQAGLKSTRARAFVFQILQNAEDKHLTAEAIYKLFLQGQEKSNTGAALNLPTIYRVLSDFESAGIVSKLRFDQNSYTYELSDTHHDHMICIECQRITEFSDDKVSKILASLAKNHNDCVIKERFLMLYTTCTGACRG